MPTTALVRFVSVSAAVLAMAAAAFGWVGLAALEAYTSLAPGSKTTVDFVAATEQTIAEAREVLAVTASVAGGVAESTGQVAASLEEIADLTETRIPEALSAIESSLPALIETASVVDDTMSTLAWLGVAYDPAVPMDEALTALADQLTGLPDAVADQGAALRSMLPGIRQTGADLAALPAHIRAMDVSLGEAETLVADYRASIGPPAIAGATEWVVPTGRIVAVVIAVAGLGLGFAGWSLADRIERWRSRTDRMFEPSIPR